MRVDIRQTHRGSILVAALEGELDDHEAAAVRDLLDQKLLDMRVPCLVLDLSGVTFMDSAGLGVILGRYKKITAKKGKMSVAGVTKPVDRLFEISGIKKIMNVYQTRDAAVRALKEEMQ